MQNALTGIKVLDLTMNLPGPFMTWLMAEMGAEILKVEPPEGGDFSRMFADSENDTYFPVFDTVNRGKKSITLDLKLKEERKIFLKLVQDYNIVVEGFRPGVMKKLGIDYDIAREICPEVIYVSLTGYGQTGCYAHKGGHDMNYQALAGSFDTGSPIDSPKVPAVPTADLGGGSLFALSGLLAAIIQRNNTGRGRHLDVSLYDGAFALNVFAFCQMQRNLQKKRNDSHFLSGTQPFYHIYETKDGRYMSLGALEQKFWINFCKAAGCEELIPAQFGGKKIIQKLAEIFKTETQEQWIALFKDKDACCEPILSIREVIAADLCRDRDLVSKDTFNTYTLNNPIKSVGQKPQKPLPPPVLGHDNNKIFGHIRNSSGKKNS